MVLVCIIKVIFNNENRILFILVFNDDVYDIDNFYIGLLVVLNENGVDYVVKFNLNDEELKLFRKFLSILKYSIDFIILE